MRGMRAFRLKPMVSRCRERRRGAPPPPASGRSSGGPPGVYSLPVSGWSRTVHIRLSWMLSRRSGQAGERGRRPPHSARASSIQASAWPTRRTLRAAAPSPPHTATMTMRPVAPSPTSRTLATSPRRAPSAWHARVPAENAAATSSARSWARHTSPPHVPSPPRGPPPPPGPPPASTHRPSHPHGASPITSRRPGAFTVARIATASTRRDHSSTIELADGRDSGDGSASRSNSTRAYDPSGAWGPTRDTIQYQSSSSRRCPCGSVNASRTPIPSFGPAARTSPAQRRASRAPTCITRGESG